LNFNVEGIRYRGNNEANDRFGATAYDSDCAPQLTLIAELNFLPCLAINDQREVGRTYARKLRPKKFN
jgi:hypothetical protein